MVLHWEEEDRELAELINPKVLDVFVSQFSFSRFTPVQRSVAKSLIQFKDVIAQAPTGSGKTLAYVLPLFTIMLRTKNVCDFIYSTVYLLFMVDGFSS
ncbi:hypothetical protein AB6A40_009955 [Gnathostoma spinigerum]|uniref:ATP-dependent RNA helicase n=1 Tax=Gnathostoma spinigerum TaxID=75299 RepID=A0ABD6F068_9BILA